MTSVTFSRALVAGSPADLVITSTPGGAYWIPEDSIIEPEFDVRTTFADDSPDVPGQLATQSVLALGSLGLTIYTAAADDATLKAQKRALEATVWQFNYTTTLDLFGTADAYVSLPGRISWGTLDSGMAAARLARCVITIPVQPLGA